MLPKMLIREATSGLTASGSYSQKSSDGVFDRVMASPYDRHILLCHVGSKVKRAQRKQNSDGPGEVVSAGLLSADVSEYGVEHDEAS